MSARFGAAKRPATVCVPTSVGPYRILERLGTGGMGVVYLAEDSRLSRRVALKAVSHERSGQPDARRKLLREARLAGRLTHPNVAAIYDLLESPGTLHVVMEYVRGETLAARVLRGPLPAAEATAVGIQLADAVSAAHSVGVIHRDLKLANVMLTPDGQAKILDFGLARARIAAYDSEEDAIPSVSSQERRVVGTPGYIAPEAFLGHRPDERSDLYSLGVMLFELVTGRRPFNGGDMMALGVAALTEPTPRITAFEPSLSGLDTVIRCAMAPKPEDRYATASELAAALRTVDALPTARTQSASLLLPVGRRRRPCRARIAAAALVLLRASALRMAALSISTLRRVPGVTVSLDTRLEARQSR